MDRERLTILADFLDTVPPKHFDLRYWWLSDTSPYYDIGCGSTGCALGWATHINEFKNDGLELKYNKNEHEVIYNDTYCITAISKFFDITTGDAYTLFYNSSYKNPDESICKNVTPHTVAERIRTYMQNGYVHT